ncbi:MAG: permease [Eubacteriales bacterium]|jgi:uncharacterized membrane protein YraQ (UPF0718 family)|nr:permease [Eubacteriales bacterium]
MHEKDSTGGIISGIMLFAAGYFLFSLFRAADTFDITGIKVFNTIFISILMQALPFMLVGVFVSSAMHVYLSDEMLVRIFPLRNGIGFLTAMLGGIFFPVCECAIVPVAVRLVKKGVAMPVALVFMFSAPIINPIVIISTLYAFPGHPEAALLRVGLGLFIALVIGLIILLLGIRTPLLTVGHDAACCDCCHEESFAHKSAGYKVRALFSHAGDEFFDVGKYIIVGAFMTGLLQTIIPRSIFVDLLSRDGLSLFIMMITAFLFSACSTSDAFIARSFLDRFSMGPVMGFMVFGPMMDIKNMLMLLGNFKKTFVLFLSVLVFLVNFIVLYFFEKMFL